MTARPPRVTPEVRLARRTGWVLILLSLCAAFLLAHLALKRFEQVLLPEVLVKTGVIGDAVRSSVANAVQLGVPFESLQGMDDFLDDTLAENPEIAFITVSSAGHRSYHRERRDAKTMQLITQDIAAKGKAPEVHIGVRAGYVNEKLYIMFGDAAVVVLVSVIGGLEVTLFFIFRWLLRPLDTWRSMVEGVARGDLARDLRSKVRGPFASLLHLSNRRIAGLRNAWQEDASRVLLDWYRPAARDVRMALFLFVLSEELLRSFLPLFVKDMVAGSSRLGVDLSISAPIIAYMFFAGAGTIFGGAMVDRLGLRRAFGLSVLLSVASLCGLAAASTLTEVLVWRSIAAVGYAIATIGCQVYIARATEASGKSGGAGLTTFVAAVAAACACGPPVGAVLADTFGIPAALLGAAAIAGMSWLVFRGVPIPETPLSTPLLSDTVAAGALPDWRPAGAHFYALLSRWPILVLLCCAVLPTKMLLAGLLFYITPLLLTQYGLSQGSIGQFFMLYYVLLLMGNAFSARLRGDLRRHARLVSAGALASGVGVLLLPWFDTPLGLALAIFCFGLAQSFSITPASALMLQLSEAEAPQVPRTVAISLMRVAERVGGVCGAALAALLSAWLGYAGAAASLGLLTIVIAAGALSLLVVAPTRREHVW